MYRIHMLAGWHFASRNIQPLSSAWCTRTLRFEHLSRHDIEALGLKPFWWICKVCVAVHPHTRAQNCINNIQHFFFANCVGASHRWPVIQCCHNMPTRFREQQTKTYPRVSVRGILSSSSSHILVKTSRLRWRWIASYGEIITPWKYTHYDDG